MAVLCRAEGHVAAAQRQVFPGNQIAAVDVQLVARAEGNVAVAAADGAALAARPAGIGAAFLHRLANGKANAAGAHQARLFLFTLMAFLLAFLRGGDGKVTAGGQRNILRARNVAAGHRDITARLHLHAVTAQSGADCLPLMQLIVRFEAAGRHHSFAALLAVFNQIAAAVARVQADIPSGTSGQCATRRDVGRMGNDVLPGAELQRTAGRDARADIGLL